MILLCVTLSGEEVSGCWCSWYSAVPSMPPGTTEKNPDKYSSFLRLLGQSHVIQKLRQKKQNKRSAILCESATKCICPPPLPADIIFKVCHPNPPFSYHHKLCAIPHCLAVYIKYWKPWFLILLFACTFVCCYFIECECVSGDKACSPLLAKSSQCHFLNKF